MKPPTYKLGTPGPHRTLYKDPGTLQYDDDPYGNYEILEGADGWLYCTAHLHTDSNYPEWCNHLGHVITAGLDAATRQDGSTGTSFLPDKTAVPIFPTQGSWALIEIGPTGSDGAREAMWYYGLDPVTRVLLGYLYAGEGRRELRALCLEHLRYRYFSGLRCNSPLHHTYAFSKAYKPKADPEPSELVQAQFILESGCCAPCIIAANLDDDSLVPDV